jgi:hypothetical protein
MLHVAFKRHWGDIQANLGIVESQLLAQVRFTLYHSKRYVSVLARTGLSSNVEDLKHFLLECPAYDDLRAVCPAFPADVYTTLSNPGCVAAVMGHSAQAALANTLFHMKVRRSELLELPWV